MSEQVHPSLERSSPSLFPVSAHSNAGTATSVMDPGSNDSTCASSQKTREEQLLIEKRLRRQAKNKLKKEEMKRIKEEEKRRKLYEPKDQRVKMVNQNELATMLKPHGNYSQSTKAKPDLPNISPDDFPILGSSKSKPRGKPPQPISHAMSNVDSSTSTIVNGGKIKHEAEFTSAITVVQTPILLPSKDQLSKPKRKDPIHIDVLTALKKCEFPKAHLERSTPAKKDTTAQRSGNQLDASNPERKKGKVREIPKAKKPSQLKRIILKERDEKKKAVEGDVSVAHLSLDKTVAKELKTPQEMSNSNDLSTPESNTVHECDPVREFKNNLSQETDSQQRSSPLQDTVKRPTIHSRKFREYCNHSLSPQLDALLSALIVDIVKFQDRAYFNDPIKAHAKRRFVLGFREAQKYLLLKKLKLLIIAPDLEKVKSEGGIDDLIENLKEEATKQAVLYAFGVGRRNLKKLTNKAFKLQGISCIGVLNYEGAQDNFNKIQDLLPSLRLDYAARIKSVECVDSQFTIEQHEGDCTTPEPKDLKCENLETRGSDEDLEAVATFLTKLKELGKD